MFGSQKVEKASTASSLNSNFYDSYTNFSCKVITLLLFFQTEGTEFRNSRQNNVDVFLKNSQILKGNLTHKKKTPWPWEKNESNAIISTTLMLESSRTLLISFIVERNTCSRNMKEQKEVGCKFQTESKECSIFNEH